MFQTKQHLSLSNLNTFDNELKYRYWYFR